MPWVDVSFEGPVSHFEIEILPIFLIWNRKGSWNVHFLPGEYLEYLACERLNSSYILIRASDWSWVEGNSKQSKSVVFPAEPIQFWTLIETSTPIDPHEINLYWIWFGLCEIRLLNQAKSNIDVLRKSVRFFIKKYFFSGKWPISWKASSEENGTGQYPVWMTQKPRELKSKKIPGEACPRTPLETYPFGARLENRSVFIPGSAPGISN